MGLSRSCQILLLGAVLLPAVGIAQTSLAEPDVPVPFANAQNLSSSAQQPPTATFTAKTDLVLVPVVVRQGKQPVTCLTKNDFKIFENLRVMEKRLALRLLPSIRLIPRLRTSPG